MWGRISCKSLENFDAMQYLTTPDWDFTRRGYLRAKTAVLSTMGEWKVHPTRNLTVKRIRQLYKRLRDILGAIACQESTT